jgi:hypothetical protein
MEDLKLFIAGSFTDHFLANLALAKLENSGIKAVLDHDEKVVIDNLDSYRIMVTENDLPKALEILKEVVNGNEN